MGRLRRVDLDEHAARLVGVANEAHGFFRGHSVLSEIKRVVSLLVRACYVGERHIRTAVCTRHPFRIRIYRNMMLDSTIRVS